MEGDPIKTYTRPRHGHKWGRWRLNTKDLTLEHVPGHKDWDYWVDLEDCTDASSILDWILQVARKVSSVPEALMTPEDVGNLVKALLDICPGLQGEVCPWGQSPNEPEPHVDFKKIIQEGGDHD